MDDQTQIIGSESISITAKDTTLTGAVIANASINEDGSFTDNGNLDFTTETLGVNHLEDLDTAESKGFNVGSNVNLTGEQSNKEHQDNTELQTGSYTLGGHYNGYDKRQLTQATLGSGNVQVGEGSQDTLNQVNRDLGASQIITKDIEIAGLDMDMTVDTRLFSEEGRNDIVNDFDLTGVATQTLGNDLVDLTKLEGEDNDDLFYYTNAISGLVLGLVAEVPVLVGQGDIKNKQLQLVTADSKYMKDREEDFQPIEESDFYKDLPEDKQKILKDKKLFITKYDIEITENNATYQNATNGMLNDEGLALINAMQQTSETIHEGSTIQLKDPTNVAFTLNYNPTHGFLADALESGIDKLGLWKTGIAKQTGEFIRDVTTARGQEGSNFNNHSQGNILNKAGIEYINSKGSYDNGGFKPREYFIDETQSEIEDREKGLPTWAGFGSPVNTEDMRETVVVENGFGFQGMFTHEGDYVGEGIGGNKLDNQQAPFSEKFELGEVFDLFDENSPHSTYGCSEYKYAKCGDR